MPVVPRFSLVQDEQFLVLVVRLPYVRVSDAEVAVDGSELSFYCKPYLLRLTLPGALVDDERVSSTYDPDDQHGTLTVRVPKAVPGEPFPDLDLVTRLLQPRARMPERGLRAASTSGSAAHAGAVDVDLLHVRAQPDEEEEEQSGSASVSLEAQLQGLSLDGSGRRVPERRMPLIQVIGSSDGPSEASSDGGVVEPLCDGPESAGQQQTEALSSSTASGASYPPSYESGDVNEAAPSLTPLLTPGASAARYGFNRGYAGVLTASLLQEMPGVVDLPDPDGTPACMRAALRHGDEDSRWDPHRYADDNGPEAAEDPVYTEAVGLAPWWAGLLCRSRRGADIDDGSPGGRHAESSEPPWAWTDAETEELRQLPNREFLVDGELVGGTHRGATSGSLGGSAAQQSCDASSPVRPALSPALQPEATRLLMAFVPLLASYAYDHRVTGGEPSCESSWTVATLTPTLSWLDDELEPPLQPLGQGGSDTSERRRAHEGAPFVTGSQEREVVFALSPGSRPTLGQGDIGLTAVQSHRLPPPNASGHPDDPPGQSDAQPLGDSATVRPSGAPASAAPLLLLRRVHTAACAFVRRVLTFPYLRRWDLALLCLRDAAALLRGGTRPVLRAVLATRRLLRADDTRYLLCTLLLDDYAVWLQSVPQTWLEAVGAALSVVVAAGPELAATARLTKSSPAFAGWQLPLIDEEGPEAVDDADREVVEPL